MYWQVSSCLIGRISNWEPNPTSAKEIRQTFFHFFFRILLMNIAQMIFDVPLGDSIGSLLITSARPFLFGNPLARELFVGV